MSMKRQYFPFLNAAAILLTVFGSMVLLESISELASVQRQIRRPLPSSLRGGASSGQNPQNRNSDVIMMGSIFPPDIPQPLISFPQDATIKEFYNSSDLNFSAPGGANSSTIGGKVAKSPDEQAAKAQLLIQAYRYYVPPWWPVHLPRPPPGWLPWPPPVPPVQIMRWLYPHVYTVTDHTFENYQTGKKNRRNSQPQKRGFENSQQDTPAVKVGQHGVSNPNLESKQQPDDISPIQVLAEPNAK